MSTLSVPLYPLLEEFIDSMIQRGIATNKSDVVRKALLQYAEDQAVNDVLQNMREYKGGNVLKRGLTELLKKMP